MVKLNVNLNTLLILGAVGLVGYKAYKVKKDYGENWEQLKDYVKQKADETQLIVLEIDEAALGVPSMLGKLVIDGLGIELKDNESQLYQDNYNWLEGADPNKFYGI